MLAVTVREIILLTTNVIYDKGNRKVGNYN